ncbi:MAG: hypothetical protein ACFFBD_16330, partial [Candidatus Hodarchaeota archaeon]
EALDNSEGVAWVLFQIGTVYRHKGELNSALDSWERSIALFEVFGNDLYTSYPLSGIILLLSLELQDLPQAQKYLSQLQDLHERTPHMVIRHLSLLTEALVLKQSKRMRDKAQAQVIFQQLITDKHLWFVWARIAMVHLCELLLVEVQSFGDLDVWDEAKTLIQQLYVQAQDHHSFSMVVDALLLRAKVAAIDGDLPQALEYYKQARLTAEEKGLGLRLQKVDIEQKRFEAEFEKWQSLIQRNASLQDRLAQAQLEDYILQVQKKVAQMKDNT